LADIRRIQSEYHSDNIKDAVYLFSLPSTSNLSQLYRPGTELFLTVVRRIPFRYLAF
jgi:hypothetical protein